MTTLLERVRAATGASAALDRELYMMEHGFTRIERDQDSTGERLYAWCGEKYHGEITSKDKPRYTASVDAILALIERELPGWGCESNKVAHSGRGTARIYPGNDNNSTQTAFGAGATPALALCAAFLAAKATP